MNLVSDENLRRNDKIKKKHVRKEIERRRWRKRKRRRQKRSRDRNEEEALELQRQKYQNSELGGEMG